ncbi:hypothetical protein GCM10029978_046780 [Actinoallomurus acanthiterrae]
MSQIAARPCGQQRICAELADALVRQLFAAGLDLAAAQARTGYQDDDAFRPPANAWNRSSRPCA